jgi:hypothetical protein
MRMDRCTPPSPCMMEHPQVANLNHAVVRDGRLGADGVSTCKYPSQKPECRTSRRVDRVSMWPVPHLILCRCLAHCASGVLSTRLLDAVGETCLSHFWEHPAATPDVLAPCPAIKMRDWLQLMCGGLQAHADLDASRKEAFGLPNEQEEIACSRMFATSLEDGTHQRSIARERRPPLSGRHLAVAIEPCMRGPSRRAKRHVPYKDNESKQ